VEPRLERILKVEGEGGVRAVREPEGERDGDGGGGAGVAADTEFILREAIEDQVDGKDYEEEEELAQPDDNLPARRVPGEAAGQKGDLPLQAAGGDGRAPTETGRAPLALADTALKAEDVARKVDEESPQEQGHQQALREMKHHGRVAVSI
jgi:hypothetical protein